MHWLLALTLLLLTIGVAQPADAACTAGTDCYCDCVNGPATIGNFKNATCQTQNIPVDPNKLVCEDFDHPLYRDTGTANTNPGPWWADVTQAGNRGVNSLWHQRYGNFASGANYSSGQPSSPFRGTPCGFSQCSGGPVYHPTGLFSGSTSTNDGHLFMVATGAPTGDFNSEVSSLSAPSGKSGGGSGHFAGNASMAFRNKAGSGGTSGILGVANFGSPRQTFGATMALAYPTNLLQLDGSGVIATAARTAWKHDEWTNGAGYSNDALFTFVHSSGWNTAWAPFYGFIVRNSQNPATQASCLAAVAAATDKIGSWTCDSTPTLTWFATGSGYDQALDYPLGTWGCIRATYENLGNTNSAIKITLTPTAGRRSGQEITVVQIRNLNLTQLAPGASPKGYQFLKWNNYANGAVATTATAFRYEDNMHVTAGPPVSCAQIGFGGAAQGPSAPSAPINGTVTTSGLDGDLLFTMLLVVVLMLFKAKVVKRHRG